MKKIAFLFALVTLVTAILIPVLVGLRTAKAASSSDYTVANVDHQIGVMYNGYILLNNTVQIVGNSSDVTAVLPSFRIGFPYKYGDSVTRCLAYGSSGTFDVILGVPLENRIGFYGVEIGFPQPLNISIGAINVFNVVFVLSNNLLTNASAVNRYTLDFPAYPSLASDVTNCNVSITLPEGAENLTLLKDDGNVNVPYYSRQNMPAFTYSPANVTFAMASPSMLLFDVDQMDRQIAVNGVGDIEAADSYYVTSKEQDKTLDSIMIILPANASNVGAKDQFGRTMPEPILVEASTQRYSVNFSIPVASLKSTSFTVHYSLSTQVYLSRAANGAGFNATFPLFQHLDYYVKQVTESFVLPEGARILSYTIPLSEKSTDLTRRAFQEMVTVTREDISSLDNIFASQNFLQIIYEYNPLWLSFRPTLWVLSLAVVGCAVFFVWKRPKAPSAAVVTTFAARARPESLRSYVEMYEEKRKILQETDSLEAMVQKGRIPRRRYKVRRKTLETRLGTLERSLADIGGQLHAAGGKYMDLMRQLEVAETEINEVNTNIKSIEARHGRGELSLEAYRKLLSDYRQRREKAETTISGILLRLREEVH